MSDLSMESEADSSVSAEMDMATARTVLSAIVNTDEATFNEGSDLSKIGGYDID